MKILVVDDEPLALKRMSGLVKNLPHVTSVIEASNGVEAIEQSKSHLPDLVFLDIEMPGMNGIEAAEALTKLEKKPMVIFTTAYSDFALDAFKVHAIDYLLKPVKNDKLLSAWQRACDFISESSKNSVVKKDNRKNIAAKISGSIKLIPVDEIIYFQAEQKYVTVRYVNGETIIEETLKNLHEEFAELFVRIHRNALVAKKFITGVTKNTQGHNCVVLTNEAIKLEISRRHLSEIKKLLIQM